MTENEFKLYLALGLCAPGVLGGQKEATMYSYNGVVLPKLPESEFPYAYIGSNKAPRFYLYQSAKPFFVKDSGYTAPNVTTSLVCYLCTTHTGDYWGIDDSRFTEATPDSLCAKPVWSNYDMYNADGTLHLSASTPVQV